MSFRKEKKFKLTISEKNFLKQKLINLGMIELYPRRKISSIYFDTRNLDFYINSEEGVLPRKKVRIRWYNNNTKKLLKEVKISSLEGRFKISKKLKTKLFLNYINYQITDKDYGILKPVILISYFREYYKLNNLRLTFDTKINYKNLQQKKYFSKYDSECVMEIKSNFETADDYIYSVINYPTSRFSKYSRGILFTQGFL